MADIGYEEVKRRMSSPARLGLANLDPTLDVEKETTVGCMTTGLVDLPSAVFSDVAKYLALPSRALFALAMTAPSSSWCECDEN